MSAEGYDNGGAGSARNEEARKRVMKAMKEAEEEQRRKGMLRQLLEESAYERVMNIRASNYELYRQIADVVASIAQSGKVRGKLTEQQFISIFSRLTARPETQISFKRK